MSMFKSIRRNSKQLLPSSRRKSVPLFTTNEKPPSVQEDNPSKITFFHLPAELRNAIYEQIAEETNIAVPIPSNSKKPSKLLPATPALLLTSKQTRQEFLPILLEYGTINFQVKDWDFRPITRLIGSLYSTELKSLRQNDRLGVRLWQDRLDEAGVDRLRKWLVNRSSGLDRLAFSYVVMWGRYTQIIPTSSQVQKVNIYMQRRMVLGQNLGAMTELEKNIDETLQFELQPIRSVLVDEDRMLGADPTMPWQGNSALMMYGIPIRASVR